MTDDAIAMLQKDVERLEARTADQATELAAVKATVDSMGREIGRLRQDFSDGITRIEQRFDRSDSRTDAAREETRVWMTRFGWLFAGSLLSIVATVLATRALL